MNTLTAPSSKPWYREPWPWFLISLPATAVIAGVATVWIAMTSADGLVVGDYYKAGLAINQTLERDDAARALALSATLQREQGSLSLILKSQLKTPPDQLVLTLAHPTRPGMDQTLQFSHAGNGHYRAALPTLNAGKWHAQLTDADARWRVSGVLHSPFDAPATLAAAPLSQPKED